jgi:hypothetical protein
LSNAKIKSNPRFLRDITGIMTRIIFYSDMLGREEGDARRNVEEHQSKGMGSAPEPEQNKSHPDEVILDTLHGSSFVNAESQAQQPAQSADNPPRHTQYIVGLCKTAIGKTLFKIHNAIVFIDHHNGVVTAFATITIAILTGFYVGYAKNQWMVMNAQLQEIRSSSAQTDKMITIATAQSEAAKISAATAQQTLIANQRAWVGPSYAKADGIPMVGKKFDISIMYHNTGREPARNMSWTVKRLVATPEEEKNRTLHGKLEAILNECFGLSLQEDEAGQIIFPSTGIG